MKTSLANALAVFGSFQSVYGWSALGHMIVAKIAQMDLIGSGDQSVYQKAKEYALLGKEMEPNMTDNFESVSTWADEIIMFQNVHQFDEWHYTTQSFSLDGTPKFNMAPAQNVVNTLQKMVKTLNGSKNATIEKAMLTRFLIHFVGDMHQPLHTTSLISENYTDGDQGGNLFKIFVNTTDKYSAFAKNMTNLHQYWDYAGGKFYDVSPPYSQKDLEWVGSMANELMGEYTRKSFKELSERNITRWTRSLFNVVTNDVYGPLLANGPQITNGYAAHSYPIMMKQITLAGYRLADLFRSMFFRPSEKSGPIQSRLERTKKRVPYFDF